MAKSARADIQGLRALAVGLVLVYHLLPNRLTGGFVGVDVFFVISGFLIIGSLADEIARTGRLALPAFYGRRIRRLLPAASVVLLATVAVVLLLTSMARWPAIMQEIVASALNVQNWQLAIFSADYAHATAAASPVQHFWSLSVEEQFYLLIPIVMTLSAFLGRRKGVSSGAVLGAVLVFTVASFVYSVLATTAPPGAAYFMTTTRLWELGIGGLAAIAVRRVRFGSGVRLLLGWAGLAAVAYSAIAFTTAMAFPGWIAVVPTLGTVAMLLAGTGERSSVVELPTLLGIQPLRYIGDISYSLYLWHWPVIVFMLEYGGQEKLTRVQVLVAGTLSLVLAVLSKHFVEDPFRRRRTATAPSIQVVTPPVVRRPFRLRLRATYLLGAAMVLATLVTATVPWRVAAAERDRLIAASAAALVDPPRETSPPDPGTIKPIMVGAPLLPDPAIADTDVASAWKDGCATYDLTKYPATSDHCVYGDRSASRTMVLVGDSHMTMFSSAIVKYAEKAGGWRVKLLVHDGCAYGDLPPAKSGYPLPVCGEKAYELLPELLKMKPDLVVTSGFTQGSEVVDGERRWYDRSRVLSGYRALLEPLSEAGIRVAAIRDVPLMATNTPRCLLRTPDAPTACGSPRRAALGEQDPLVEVVSALPNSTVADLTPWLCDQTTCPAVIGNLVVYRDNHLTDTFVRMLTYPLAAQLNLT
nr:acyltransferase family protein [Kibdelosporangium sp. MJ126-NF4]CEL14356.1 acyltransferase 3 [Kibdelosporangium sp. MJ126-NF4]CTQ88722.1 acyltransferase 3 [Kibdelosporangium sp. MJ126-NF4]